MVNEKFIFCENPSAGNLKYHKWEFEIRNDISRKRKRSLCENGKMHTR